MFLMTALDGHFFEHIVSQKFETKKCIFKESAGICMSTNYRGGQKKDPFTEIEFFCNWSKSTKFSLYIYIYISIVIINSHYRSICQPSTSITCWSLGLIVSIYFISDFFWNFIPLFNNGFFQQDELPFDLCINFAPGIPRYQNLLDSNMDYLVASDGALVIEVVSCL